ncbi:hypothetical protein [Pseudobutyrivibrio ruminis]|uniref:Uncharacterized protein n=1 Tax=Pseudobutyrivibrio ruminis TaxID=46206 RepID=A0A2G3DS69_9FIRM|nr:hypothetical protein [Pseudobutyrivibrio ruminis]PHU33888.1 hypothetical protein CSX01_12965 [Pseudobutyrivibrio ruminis]
MKKFKNYFSNKSLPAKVGIIIAGIFSLYILFQIGGLFFVMSILWADLTFSKKYTYTDVENYTNYIGVNSVDEYSNKWDMDESIFPEQITDSMKVEEFSFTCYNPWDVEYVGYLTATYSQDGYNTELDRLSHKEQDQYKGLFNVSGEPDNYSILAIDADKDFGLVYAIKPDSEGTTITYVEVIVPGKLEMWLDKYLPEKYQLKDMDMSKVNKE